MLFFKSKIAAFLLLLTAFIIICGCGNSADTQTAAPQAQPPEISSAAADKKPESAPPQKNTESQKTEPAPDKSGAPVKDNALQSEAAPTEPDKAESEPPAQTAESDNPANSAPSSSENEKAEKQKSGATSSSESEKTVNTQQEAESQSAEPSSSSEAESVPHPITSADISADIPATPAQRPTKLTVRMPSAPGSKCESSGSAEIDYSNAAQGYIMVKYSGSNPKVKLQITGPNKVTYTYTLHKGGYTSFPLTAGSGTYSANIFENVSGNSYALALGTSFSAKLSSSLSPYLYPNQYVNYSANSNAVAKGDELAAKASTRLGVVQEVYNYLISNISYDHQKAATVKSGYTPNVDSTLSTKTGICFDYAALMATMLRTQDIPTRLEVGYVSGGIYHAWISVYIPEQGWVNGIIKFDGTNWSMMDPTFAASSSVPQSYTTASYSYSVKYLY